MSKATDKAADDAAKDQAIIESDAAEDAKAAEEALAGPQDASDLRHLQRGRGDARDGADRQLGPLEVTDTVAGSGSDVAAGGIPMEQAVKIDTEREPYDNVTFPDLGHSLDSQVVEIAGEEVNKIDSSKRQRLNIEGEAAEAEAAAAEPVDHDAVEGNDDDDDEDPVGSLTTQDGPSRRTQAGGGHKPTSK